MTQNGSLAEPEPKRCILICLATYSPDNWMRSQRGTSWESTAVLSLRSALLH